MTEPIAAPGDSDAELATCAPVSCAVRADEASRSPRHFRLSVKLLAFAAVLYYFVVPLIPTSAMRGKSWSASTRLCWRSDSASSSSPCGVMRR